MIRRLQYQREKARRYDDLFFHPLVCHVCKRLNDGNTFLCDCGVISYCCEEHMTMDREQSDNNVGHGEICDVIKQLMSKKLMRGFSGGTIYEWINCKNNYMRLIKTILLRELTRHEKLMISHIRACLVCYKETDLKPCKSCFCVDYCEAHRIKNEYHPCDELKAWLYFEIQAISINSVPEWLTFHDFPDRGVVDDMQSFYKTYVLPGKDASWTILDTIYTEYLSWPLTTYYGLREANLLNVALTQNSYVIHIVAARDMDRNNLSSWEIFLHIFKKPMKLVVILIGMGLTSELENDCGILQTCWEKCMSLGHQLYFSCHRMLYYDYAKSMLFTAPNVIIGFQLEKSFDYVDSWVQFLTSLKDPLCPVIITTRSRSSSLKFTNYIKNSLSETVKPVLERLNKFKSLRPQRDNTNGNLFYLNEYIVIYVNLNIPLSMDKCIQA